MAEAKILQFKRNEVSEITAYTPKLAEPIFDVNKKQFRIGDNTTPGGIIPSQFYYTPMQSGEYSADVNDVVLADCQSSDVVITLPTNVSSGATVKVLDVYYAASETGNTITVKRGAETDLINNSAEDFVIDVPRAYISFIYIADSKNWVIDLGGAILPKYEIAVTDELEWTEDGALGIKSVDFAKISSPMDLGEF